MARAEREPKISEMHGIISYDPGDYFKPVPREKSNIRQGSKKKKSPETVFMQLPRKR